MCKEKRKVFEIIEDMVGGVAERKKEGIKKRKAGREKIFYGELWTAQEYSVCVITCDAGRVLGHDKL